jgi:hypothetical protein
MAALTATAVGTALAPAAAAGGGDTAPGGAGSGGWDTTYLLVVVGTTATVVTVDGVALPSMTSQSVLVPLRRQNGASVAVTYSQVTGVTVAAVKSASTAYTSYGN